MPDRDRASAVAAVSGLAVGVVGGALIGVGLWARREVERALARERIVSPEASPPGAPVTTPGAARSLAEVIRSRTIQAAGGRTYAETDAFVAGDGGTTSAGTAALMDERTGGPVENPDHALWIQSTTLQTALMQAYLSARLAELTLALGVALAAAGTGLAALGRSSR